MTALGPGLGVSVPENMYLFAPGTESKEGHYKLRSEGASCWPDPACVRFAYRVEEHSLFLVDELHQNGRLVMSDIPHVVPPAQNKGNRVGPKTIYALMNPHRRVPGRFYK